MTTPTRKAWKITGYTWIGCAYCPDCLPEPHHPDRNGNTPQPLFVSDNHDLTCELCLNPIE